MAAIARPGLLCECEPYCVYKGRSCSSGLVLSQPADGSVVRRGFVRSPNWPGEYPAGLDCEWTISADRGRQILVVVSRVELATGGGDSSGTTGEHQCRSNMTDSSTNGDWLLITDSAGDRPIGFYIYCRRSCLLNVVDFSPLPVSSTVLIRGQHLAHSHLHIGTGTQTQSAPPRRVH